MNVCVSIKKNRQAFKLIVYKKDNNKVYFDFRNSLVNE